MTRTSLFGRPSKGVTVAAIKAAVIALDNTDRLSALQPTLSDLQSGDLQGLNSRNAGCINS